MIMKKLSLYSMLFIALPLAASCDLKGFDIQPDKCDTTIDTTVVRIIPFDENHTTTYDTKVPTLLNRQHWTCDTLDNGCVWYNFTAFDDVSNAAQTVNVLEVDMTSKRYKLDFAYKVNADSLSSFVDARQQAGLDVMGGVNANYELDATYIRIGGSNMSEVTIPASHLRAWKHEGAILSYADGEVKIRLSSRTNPAQATANYKYSKAVNIISSAPSLIEDYKNIGSSFVDMNRLSTGLNVLDYEDKDRHQGVRHPRTAVALTGDGDLLLITVDGRWAGKAEGMTADELTRFIIKYFNPRYALNMDGGGSTTMCVRGRGDSRTHVVNYPTDNRKYNHYGQRPREAHLIIEKVR